MLGRVRPEEVPVERLGPERTARNVVEVGRTAAGPSFGLGVRVDGLTMEPALGRRHFVEETPRLSDNSTNRALDRDEAFKKWNKDVAGKAGNDFIPGV